MKVIKNKWFRLGIYVLGYLALVLFIVSATVTGLRYGVFYETESFDRPFEETANVKENLLLDLKHVQKTAKHKQNTMQIDLDSKKFDIYEYSDLYKAVTDGKEASAETFGVDDIFQESDPVSELIEYTDIDAGVGSIYNGYANKVDTSGKLIRMTWGEYRNIVNDVCVKYGSDQTGFDAEYEFLWNNIGEYEISPYDYFANINGYLYIYSDAQGILYYSPNNEIFIDETTPNSDYMYFVYDESLANLSGADGKKKLQEYILSSKMLRSDVELLYTKLTTDEKGLLNNTYEDRSNYTCYSADAVYSFDGSTIEPYVINTPRDDMNYPEYLSRLQKDAKVYISYDSATGKLEQWYTDDKNNRVDYEYISSEKLNELKSICDNSFCIAIVGDAHNDGAYLCESIAYKVCGIIGYPIWLAVISGILFLASVIVLIIGEPAKLFFVDKAPYIVWAGVYLGVLVLATGIMGLAGISSVLITLIMKEIGAIIAAAAFGILLLYIATAAVIMNVVRRVKCGKFLDGFITVIIIKKIFGRNGLVNKLPGKVGLLVAAGVFLMINIFAFIGLGSAVGEGGIVLGFFLIIFNILAVLLFLKYSSDTSKLLKVSRRLENGELDAKVNVDELKFDSRDLGESLNNLGDGLSKAVEASIRDERTKAELITNVSHDIKTPLTSIINYVDLLKKEDIDNEKAKEYINVLDQKSERLKQLILDLIEASKTSTGNVELELMNINFVELINQCLGEHEDKFNENNLEVVKGFKTDNALINADGRRVYRIIDNLMNNVAKYAKPDTRVYMDIDVINQEIPNAEDEESNSVTGSVMFSIKNVSKEMLNITPEELSERFVRGDKSRNTEGSGLGLSIAKNLTELQNGSFEISIDGDLFKVNVIFPLVKNNVN